MKNKLKLLVLFLGIGLTSACVTGEQTFTVTFDSRGGSGVDSITEVALGSTIAKPEDPSKSGYEFGGWYKSTSFAESDIWNFTTSVVNANITLYANWEESVLEPLLGNVVIWQAYGNGAKNESAVSHSFVELYNLNDSDISLVGSTLQYGGVGDVWNSLTLTGTIKAHSSFLILGNKSNDADTVSRYVIDEGSADFVADFSLDNDGFKVCLVSNTSLISTENPFNTDGSGTKVDGYVDLFGGQNGDPVDGYEGSELPGLISKQKSARRVSLEDTDNNVADFESIDYRLDKGMDSDKLENYRPKNIAFGPWNPLTFAKL